MHENKFYEMINFFCELKQVNNQLKIQISHNLYDDEYEKDTMFIYEKDNIIDSVRILRNGEFDRSIKFKYQDGNLIEKKYYSKSFSTSKIKYQFTNSELTIEQEKNNSYSGKSIYKVQDTLVNLKTYNEGNQIIAHKEFVITTNPVNNKVAKILEYDILQTGEKNLNRYQKYTYSEDSTEIFEELLNHQITHRTIIDTWAEEKTIETTWLKKNEKRIVKYNYFE